MTLTSAGRLFWAGFTGDKPPENLRRRLETGTIGGIILFARNFSSSEQLQDLARQLHACWKGPGRLLLGVDQEGGRVARIRNIAWPPALQLGQAGDPGLTREVARLMGLELAHFGFNTDFAPVLDVWTQPENRVIGDRAFGRDPATVALHGAAFAQGLRDAGIFTCGKHFPGHGDTKADSHEELPVCERPIEVIENIHEFPFRQAAAHLDFLMTAHILAPAVDANRPATLSETWAQRARRLPFNGILVSDDLEMGAMRGFVPHPALLALQAGLDMCMVCASQDVLETGIEMVERANLPFLERRIGRVDRMNLNASGLRPLADYGVFRTQVQEVLARLQIRE